MAKLGSSLKPTPIQSKGRLGGTTSQALATDLISSDLPQPKQDSTTLIQRLEAATLAGALPIVPPAYADGDDWKTISGDDVFAKLYLAANQYEQITDAQVLANLAVLKDFWAKKQQLSITGNKHIEEVYGTAIITSAQEILTEAATFLADAPSRKACFDELSKRRQQKATVEMDKYLQPVLVNSVISPKTLEIALKESKAKGFEPAEAEKYILEKLQAEGFAPVKTVNQNPNLLLATWTPGGVALSGGPHAKVMGQDVYSLEEAGQVLYNGFVSGDEKAVRNLDTEDYLTKIAEQLRENDAMLDIREIMRNSKLSFAHKRLSVLYFLSPGLPFYLGDAKEAFANPEQFLSRTAVSSQDFITAEDAFKTGDLQIWLQAAATAKVKAALPDKTTALDFRKFLHVVNSQFPLWIGELAFAGPEQLASYIRQDEISWKMVYGSLAAGYLAPWLHALGLSVILEKFTTLVEERVKKGGTKSERTHKLGVQALLEALDPKLSTPKLEMDLKAIDLTGLSGETQAEQILTITNVTGGYMDVNLALKTALDGVSFSKAKLFFDQRSPGQKISVKFTGNPVLMPRDGRHTSQLVIQTAYETPEVPVWAEAVFPRKEFLQFVGLAALALALVMGGVRYLLGLTAGNSTFELMHNQGNLLALDDALNAGDSSGLMILSLFLLLSLLVYGFVWVLNKVSKAKL